MLDNHTPSLQPTMGTFPQATRSPQYVPDQEPSSAPIYDPSLTPASEYDPPPRIVLINDQPSLAPIAEFSESAAPIYDPNLCTPPPKTTGLNIAVLPRMKTPAGDQYTGLRSLSLFTLQLIFFLVLTTIAILAFAGVLELNTNNWGNFPIHYRGISSDLGDYTIAMAPGAAIALPWVFLRTTTEKITFSSKVMLRLPFVACAVLGIVTSNGQENSVAAGCGILAFFYLGLQLYHGPKLKFTKIILENTIDEKRLYYAIITIAGAGLAIHLLYSLLFALVVTGYGQPTSRLNKVLPYILIILSYISYLWTSQVLANTIYASVAALTSSHYHPAGSPPEDSTRTILKRVFTKSLGSISYASLESRLHMFYQGCNVHKPFSPKYALYNVATYGMDYCTARKDIRARLAQLKMALIPESSSRDRLVIGYALLAGILSTFYFFLFIHDNVHTICIGVLASMQTVFTAAAAVDAVVASVCLAMAHNPVAFAKAFPYLFGRMNNIENEFAAEFEYLSP
ncbi:MAG: hypothetical protein BYD32DRAFT_208957 [Podila humilis]|nr:MAG: hypothetical protein BYD32DRAFT_208957 [Podila humilis]